MLVRFGKSGLALLKRPAGTGKRAKRRQAEQQQQQQLEREQAAQAAAEREQAAEAARRAGRALGGSSAARDDWTVPEAAEARADGLSADEMAELAALVAQLPAGGAGAGVDALEAQLAGRLEQLETELVRALAASHARLLRLAQAAGAARAAAGELADGFRGYGAHLSASAAYMDGHQRTHARIARAHTSHQSLAALVRALRAALELPRDDQRALAGPLPPTAELLAAAHRLLALLRRALALPAPLHQMAAWRARVRDLSRTADELAARAAAHVLAALDNTRRLQEKKPPGAPTSAPPPAHAAAHSSAHASRQQLLAEHAPVLAWLADLARLYATQPAVAAAAAGPRVLDQVLARYCEFAAAAHAAEWKALDAALQRAVERAGDAPDAPGLQVEWRRAAQAEPAQAMGVASAASLAGVVEWALWLAHARATAEARVLAPAPAPAAAVKAAVAAPNVAAAFGGALGRGLASLVGHGSPSLAHLLRTLLALRCTALDAEALGTPAGQLVADAARTAESEARARLARLEDVHTAAMRRAFPTRLDRAALGPLAGKTKPAALVPAPVAGVAAHLLALSASLGPPSPSPLAPAGAPPPRPEVEALAHTAVSKYVGTLLALVNAASSAKAGSTAVALYRMQTLDALREQLERASLQGVTAAEPHVAVLKAQAAEALGQYSTAVQRGIVHAPVLRFLESLEALLDTHALEELPFQTSHSRQALAAWVASVPLFHMQRLITDMHKKAARGVTRKELLPAVWARIRDDLCARLARYQQLLEQCYKLSRGGLDWTPEDLRKYFDTLLV